MCRTIGQIRKFAFSVAMTVMASSLLANSSSGASPAPAGDPERRAAEWVLSIGGSVRLWAIDDTNWLDVRALENLPKSSFTIHRIYLSGNKKVTKQGLQNLDGLRNCFMLIFDSSSLDHDALLSLPPMPTLTILDVDRTTVDSAAFARISQYPLLHKIEARKTKIDDQIGDYLQHNRKLEIVRAQGTKVSAEGAERLRKRLPDCLIDYGPMPTGN